MISLKSIIHWELWHHSKYKTNNLDTEYKFKREQNNMNNIEVCLGVGTDQLFPDYTTIESQVDSKKRDQSEILSNKKQVKQIGDLIRFDQEIGFYDDLPHGDE